MSSIENSICDSIQAFVDKGVREAPYDVTLLCQIVDTSEAAAGIYRVKYQDSIFTVLSLDKNNTYANKTNVLVKIPNNDFNSTYKIIIGTTENGKLQNKYDINNDGFVDAVGDALNPGAAMEFSFNAEGRGQYRAVGAVNWTPFLTGPTYTRLWTNNNPSSSFSSQTITVSDTLSDYEGLRIVWAQWTDKQVTEENWLQSDKNAVAYVYDLRNDKINLVDDSKNIMNLGAVMMAESYSYGRRVYITDVNKIYFSSCIRLTTSTTGTNNNGLIPILIDGVIFNEL